MNFLHLRNTLNPSTVIKINVRISYISAKFKWSKKIEDKKPVKIPQRLLR